MPLVGLTETEQLPAPLLKRLSVVTQRETKPHDVFSTTELIGPTRHAYLKRTCDYTVPAHTLMYVLHGQTVDGMLDDDEGEVLTQERLRDEINSGQFDRYEVDRGLLLDWKMTGYYKIKKCLTQGMAVSSFAWCLQLNDYRMKLEALGFPVRQMYIFAIVRDFGWMSKKAGITQPWYWLKVERISDRRLKRYFEAKRRRLQTALDTKTLPPVCPANERWNEKRCKDYCAVAQFCDHGRQVLGHV